MLTVNICCSFMTLVWVLLSNLHALRVASVSSSVSVRAPTAGHFESMRRFGRRPVWETSTCVNKHLASVGIFNMSHSPRLSS